MTGEQNKPVRGRDEHIIAIATLLSVLAESKPRTIDPDATMETAKNLITEAEARGAAEQRRKDAEGQEPVGYLSMTGFEQLASALHGYANLRRLPASGGFLQKWGPDIPLYNRPANVAALEDRVRELEEKKGKRQEEARRYRTALMNICEKTSEFSISHKVAQSALKREGGV